MQAQSTRLSLFAIAACAFALSSCRRSLAAEDCLDNIPSQPGQSVCTVPGFENRDFILRLPQAFDGEAPLPIIFALHGGGGRKEGLGPMTCEDGDEDNPSCLAKVADERGFILILPDGTESRLNLRTWGATEKTAGVACVHACEQDVDDITYFKTLIDHVAKLVPVDPKRVYFTGFSDGAAMSHRIACELADRVSAVAPVGGANMIAATGTCEPSRPIPILQIHGKSDPCWPFEGGAGTCPGQPDGSYVSAVDSMIGTMDEPGWANRNGCMVDMPGVVSLPDSVSDGTTAEKQTFSGCQADVEFVTVTGAGHTWPGGDQYLDADTIGRVSKDFSASEMVVDFFMAHPIP